MSLSTYCHNLGSSAKAASLPLATASGDQKREWLRIAARELRDNSEILLQANEKDICRAPEYGLSASQLDRLRLTPERIEAMAVGLDEVRNLPDPVGRVLDGWTRPNGLQICKVSVPLGVILFIYESRPNVTADAAALAVKSGNAIILKGGKEAISSNRAIHAVLRNSLAQSGLPEHAVQLVETTEREATNTLLGMGDVIDLAIPRGGEGLIRAVAERAAMPVLKHFQGNCHLYVDQAADVDMAERLLINGKCQRPGVCNALESLLVHREIAGLFLPAALTALRGRGVEVRGCPSTRKIVDDVRPATDEDFAAEFLALVLSVKVVDDIGAAIRHIAQFGSGHTDVIVTEDLRAAQKFTADVDSAAVMVNASPRFHDGFEFGLGAEIGISTDKFHARGPCGLIELTTYKYLVHGHGQVRE